MGIAKVNLNFPPLNQTMPSAKFSMPSKTFKEIVAENLPDARFKTDPALELDRLQQQLLSGKEIPPKDLLYYQIRAGQFGLRVELLSKVGESLISSVKKFQNLNQG